MKTSNCFAFRLPKVQGRTPPVPAFYAGRGVLGRSVTIGCFREETLAKTNL
jgi:hypothetical protein